MYQALGDMLTIIVSNSHFGKGSAARVMTIFTLHFYPMTNLADLDVQNFEIISRIIELDVQSLDLGLQIYDLNIQIYDF